MVSAELHALEEWFDRFERALRVSVEVQAQAPDDLRALGIPTPDLRWHQAREYLHELTVLGRNERESAFLELMILAHVKIAWWRAGRPGFSPGQDLLEDALLWAKRSFNQPRTPTV
ncbi:MAG: hypothetical protein DLM53_12790 [Candidatus Eremiobacter antarcticus]|nr:hypothetical protein [Candidatus Eremiobacteraeota bacterium]MBC5807663.1 hypothetical protein [Candidatus Eremiobacteraeota bacterium]PZR60515.1 MAG: hypothetical protein DLM53_12790 [Candidatus Eremiobacter sp. RRmetagenome_bin22]